MLRGRFGLRDLAIACPCAGRMFTGGMFADGMLAASGVRRWHRGLDARTYLAEDFLVSLHHGSMEIESEPGRGTTVTISLPLDWPTTQETGAPEPIVRLPGETFREACDGAFRQTA